MRAFRKQLRAFRADASGAVTIDWVALTAAIVVIGIGLIYAVFGTGSGTGLNGLITSLTDTLGEASTDVRGIADGVAGDSLTPLGEGGGGNGDGGTVPDPG